ncbi:hypothetical protein [Powai lake megavirus]|uniref:Uncharacterized protein n=1 Tax=Powai lake megavirus TaxID=1842663 RepID=A0A167R169_9VIRU|nr:hypothetical protein QJ849_gp029 [Powai lake megavirus]ANB50191.1 hypothetical protein [Powai lake megavirus]
MDSIFNIFKQLASQFRTSNENHQEVQQEVHQDTPIVNDTSDQSKRKINDIVPQPSIKKSEDLRVFKSLSERPTKKPKYDTPYVCKRSTKSEIPKGSDDWTESENYRPSIYHDNRTSSRSYNSRNNRFRSSSRDRYYKRERSASRDRYYKRERSPSRDRYYKRERSPSRDRLDKRSRSLSRDIDNIKDISTDDNRRLVVHEKSGSNVIISETKRQGKTVFDYNPVDDTYYVITTTGTKIWYKGNLIHRDELPAMICENGTQKWYQYGEYSRPNDLPCIVGDTGTQIWYVDGEIERAGDKPAVIEPNGTQKWYKKGFMHRDDGPALITKKGVMMWYRWGKLHRDDGLPAIVDPNVVYKWYTHGLKNRGGDLPAIININGDLAWYCNDKLHRENGPAIIRKNGELIWYRHGEEITREKNYSWRKNNFHYSDIIEKLYTQFPYLTTWYSWNLMVSETNS